MKTIALELRQPAGFCLAYLITFIIGMGLTYPAECRRWRWVKIPFSLFMVHANLVGMSIPLQAGQLNPGNFMAAGAYTIGAGVLAVLWAPNLCHFVSLFINFLIDNSSDLPCREINLRPVYRAIAKDEYREALSMVEDEIKKGYSFEALVLATKLYYHFGKRGRAAAMLKCILSNKNTTDAQKETARQMMKELYA